MCRSEALPVIAEALNSARAEVHGVVTFYHDFRAHPAGRHVLKLCRAEACQSMGCDAIAAQVKQRLGIGFDETTADGSVTLEPVYCLGLCACRAVGDARRRGRSAGSTPTSSRRSSRRCAHEPHASSFPRDAGALALGADEVAKAIGARGRRARHRRRDRAQRLARRSIGWSRWSRSRREGRVAYGPVEAERRRRPVRRRLPRRRRAPRCARPTEEIPFLAQADAPDLRALRHHRSAVARRLQGAWRLKGLRTAVAMAPARHRRRGHRVRPARPRRRRLPDRHQVEDRARHAGRRRNTSSAMPTRATAAPSPTA